MMRYLLASAMAVGMLVASPVQAQEPGTFGPRTGDWELTLSGSGQNDRKFDRGSFLVEGELSQYLTREWNVGVRQSLTWDGGDGVSDRWNAATRLAAAYHFDMGEWRPFLGANVGYKYGGSGFRDAWTAGPEAGLKWYLQEQTFLLARVGYDFEFRAVREIDDEFRRGTFVYRLGLGFNF